MGQAEDNDKMATGVPDTTQKKDGTTSAFSAASENENTDADDDRSDYRKDGEQGRASFHPGSTTQGGSNYGQGSAYLGPSSYEQGSERSKGTNYENEAGKFAETGTQADGKDDAPETRPAKDGKEGGTETEHDEYGDKERKEQNEDEDTIGIP